ncbi:MAG TPA: 8-amino-7-oxononanoate synthase [Gammaproteobacteria bacterium]|nr:8-amino-7-oxononanoate synthase [Gammaproteobacteria bacterium]
MTGADRLDRDLEALLRRRLERGLYRRRRVVSGPQGPHLRVDGRDCLGFCSNDYLGLAGHPGPAAAMREAARRYGAGSGAAHLIVGHTAEHGALEEELAAWTGRPRALLFSTGYMANMGVINALVAEGDRVLEDRLNHASLLDGGWLCRARMQRYPHVDLSALERELAAPDAGRSLIVTDAVFSMDGDIAPLGALADLSDRYGADLMIDDAHGLGVLGPGGAGTPAELGICWQRLPIYVGTLGKALGTFGAFVAGSNTLIEALIQRARTYVFTTAPPAPVAAATRAALRLAREESWRRERLARLVTRLRHEADRAGLPLAPSRTPVQPLLIGDPREALRLSEALLQEGILVPAIRPPTVPAGTARLRITLSAAHEPGDIDRLVETLARHYRRSAA